MRHIDPDAYSTLEPEHLWEIIEGAEQEESK